jgi:uncharacterized protein
MICPVCNAEMVVKDFGGVKVHVCNGCKGIWFDQGELRKLDKNNKALNSALEDALKSPRNNNNQRGPIKCPKCAIPMQTHKYAKAKEVNVDECYGCGGFFLDYGELTENRDNYMSDAETDAYFKQLLNDPAHGDMQQELDAQMRRTEALQAFTSMLTRNYWHRRF